MSVNRSPARLEPGRGDSRPTGMHRGLVARVALVAILLVAVAGCAPAASSTASPSPSGQSGRLEGIAVAGPICPVVTDPPQSGCEARPVEGARLVIVSEDGDQVTSVITGADGRFEVELAPGTYEVQPQPVEGLMHTAGPVSAVVPIGDPVEVTISYDTGIR
jgi:Carboxypeptidase regulatory-like domain